MSATWLGAGLQKAFVKRARSVCSFVKPLPKSVAYLPIAVTDEQMDAIHAYLNKILEPTTQWRPTGEAITIIRPLAALKMYVYFMAQQWTPCSINSIVRSSRLPCGRETV